MEEQDPVDFAALVRDGLSRAGTELVRLRRLAGLQANLTTVKVRRRGQREALAERVVALQRRGELQHPDIVALCEGLESSEADIRALEDQLGAVRRGESGPAEPLPIQTSGDQAEVRLGGVVILPDGGRVCAVCHSSVTQGAAFCPTCGVRL